jgi:glycosyltransferase involved in cell wall biosynthesis
MNLTIVIPSHNNVEYLTLCYNSIRTASAQVKLIIIDDGSTDGTDGYLREISHSDSNLKYFVPGTRIGHTYWYDNGFSIADTDYIGIMHADMIVSPNFFDILEPYLNTTDVVSAKCIEPPLHPAGPEKIVRDFGMYPKDFNDLAFNEFVELECEQMKGKTAPALFAPWFIHREKYNELIGGHDKQFAPYGWEDADLFVRMMNANLVPVQPQDLLVYHFTQRGHRWASGTVGTPHMDYSLQMHITRNRFVTKWGTTNWKTAEHTPLQIPLYRKQLRINNYSTDMNMRIRYEMLHLFFNTVITDEGQVVKTDGVVTEPHYEVVFDYAINYNTEDLLALFNSLPFIVQQQEIGSYEISGITIHVLRKN